MQRNFEYGFTGFFKNAIFSITTESNSIISKFTLKTINQT